MSQKECCLKKICDFVEKEWHQFIAIAIPPSIAKHFSGTRKGLVYKVLVGLFFFELICLAFILKSNLPQ